MHRKPSMKPKPEGLQGYAINQRDGRYLQKNLLEDDNEDDSITFDSVYSPRQREPVEWPGQQQQEPSPSWQSMNLPKYQGAIDSIGESESMDWPGQQHQLISTDGSSRLVIAIDYGTTFTGEKR